MTLTASLFFALALVSADADVVGRADTLVARRRFADAVSALARVDTPAAALVRARALRGLGDGKAAAKALERAAKDPELGPLVVVERGLLALEARDVAAATGALTPLLSAGHPAMTPAVLPFATALAVAAPATYVELHPALERLRPSDDADARSGLLGLLADAQRRLGRAADATAVEKQRYLEEPVSLLTPEAPPAGVTLTAAETLARADALAAGHRNERVVAALEALADRGLTPAQLCEKQLALGLALRKLREYARAESHLTAAVGACEDDVDRHRRALYLDAKVVSIRDGLRALPLIEAFVKAYGEHSMADDVLFWAGDLHQRRNRTAEARAYYGRIEALPAKDDYCLEARWRLAWMSYRAGEREEAKRGFERLLDAGSCAPTAFDRARARYWLARLAQDGGDADAAVAHYRAAFGEDGMGFYAQLSLGRLGELAPEVAKALAGTPLPDAPAEVMAQGCAAAARADPGIGRGEALLARGLKSDAARELLAIAPPPQQVLGSTHAAALGLTAKPASRPQQLVDGRCERDLRLYIALLLDRAGAYKDAHWRLRTEFAAELAAWPTPATAALWRAAYPLAFREEIESGERESGLPDLLLQALSREESAYDDQIVSWAGAYGLTQLLLSTGRDAGKLVKPKVQLSRAEDLLEPRLNARLGGAMLARLVERYNGNVALALAAYNAGMDAATVWWKRHLDDGLDVLGEEITIQETRGYVKRVLRTYGIYRWLYRGELPALPARLAPPKTAARN